MEKSNRELQKLQTMYTYYLLKQHSAKVFLTGLVVIACLGIVIWFQKAEGHALLLAGILFVAYLLFSFLVWFPFTIVSRRVEKKRMKMGMNREEFENLIGYDRVSKKMTKKFDVPPFWKK